MSVYYSAIRLESFKSFEELVKSFREMLFTEIKGDYLLKSIITHKASSFLKALNSF